MANKPPPLTLATGIVVILAGLVLAIGGAYLLGLHALGQSQRQWCQTLSLLTSRPVPRPADPASNPSREDAWLFYVHLRQLERDFGC